MTDEQRIRIEIITELDRWLHVELTASDLVNIAHWVVTGTSIHAPVSNRTVDLEIGDDTYTWAPAVSS
jgi:hypothetical protein